MFFRKGISPQKAKKHLCCNLFWVYQKIASLPRLRVENSIFVIRVVTVCGGGGGGIKPLVNFSDNLIDDKLSPLSILRKSQPHPRWMPNMLKLIVQYNLYCLVKV